MPSLRNANVLPRGIGESIKAKFTSIRYFIKSGAEYYYGDYNITDDLGYLVGQHPE